MTIFSKKGMALFLVLSTVIIVCIFAYISLRVTSSQTRLTHHHVSRIQAQYAAMAGVNYTLEKLRVGPPTGWTLPETGSYYACMGEPIDSGVTCQYDIPDDPDIPYKIQVRIWALGQGDSPITNTAQIDAKVEYTYQ